MTEKIRRVDAFSYLFYLFVRTGDIFAVYGTILLANYSDFCMSKQNCTKLKWILLRGVWFHFLRRKITKQDCLKTTSGSRGGAVVRALAFHQCVLGSIPGPAVICGLSLLLVLFLAPRGLSPGTPVLPPLQKPTFRNSNSIRIIVKHFIMSL